MIENVSGENTEEPQEPGADATSAASASGELRASGVEPYAVPAPETVTSPDAEAAVEDFEVPPPPTFEAPPEVGAPEAASADAAGAVPEGGSTPALRRRSSWKPDDSWTPASDHKHEVAPTAAQKAERRAQESRVATARDEATRNPVSPAAGGTEGNSYRGWTIAIFVLLAALFVGAIVLIVYLLNTAGLPFGSAADTVTWATPLAVPR